MQFRCYSNSEPEKGAKGNVEGCVCVYVLNKRNEAGGGKECGRSERNVTAFDRGKGL